MIDTTGYSVTDAFFGAPYIEVDEERAEPMPHRFVRGGFGDTDTRFQFYFPPKDAGYQGRMINPLSGAHGGDETFFAGPMGEMIGGMSMCMRLGAYMIESNQGHIGDDVDPRAGDDPSMYGWRASAEVARFSKFVAEQVYGEPPHHSYVYGGSGGGRRSPLCLENAPDAWDGALPFMGGGDVAEHGNNNRVQSAQPMAFGSMFNVQRLLGDRIAAVIDAMAPGGSGNPFEGLSVHERDELENLYRLGFPRGDEHMIAEPMGQMWLFTSLADDLYDQDPSYFENFWTTPGYVGHDLPSAVEGDLFKGELEVTRTVTLDDLLTDPTYATPEYAGLQMIGTIMGGALPPGTPLLIEVDGIEGYTLGAGVKVLTGAAAGRQLYVMKHVGNTLMCDGRGEANLKRFDGVAVGDKVLVDNSRFLAFCYFARHHVMDDGSMDHLKLDGAPVHPQHPVPLMAPMMGNSYSGQFEGKLMWVHHTHDASLWPSQGVIYEQAVLAAQGPEQTARKFRLRWSQNAEHVPPMMIGKAGNRAANTWLIDYTPLIEQGLADLIAWVEDGVEPLGTTYSYEDGKVTLPDTAEERGGVQPVVMVTANGSVRAEVRVREPVTLSVVAEVPKGAGGIVDVQWDFDGEGTYPFTHDGVDGSSERVELTTEHTYDAPGEYFATALVHSHVDGDPTAAHPRLPNLAQARIVVS